MTTYIYQPARVELSEAIARHADIISGKVLDIGCGSHSRYRHLFGCDEYVRMDVVEGKNVDIVGTIESLPCDNASFDAIVCTQVLGDIFELSSAFSEMYRVLKPGGVALVSESLFDPLHDEPNDFWRFTPFSLQRLAEEVGFSIDALDSIGGYHTTMLQLMIRQHIVKHRTNEHWFARFFSAYTHASGIVARYRDAHSSQELRAKFPHSFIGLFRKS